MCQKYKQMWAHLFWFCVLPSPYSDMRAQNGRLAYIIEPSTSKANPSNAGRQNHTKTNQEIEKNISRKGMQRKCTW
jgi:hypothetical protein